MATIEDLLRAAKKAHEAGDADSARKLVQAAKGMMPAQPQMAATPPRVEDWQATPPRPNRFGDVIADATEAPLAAMKTFGAGLMDQSKSPTMAALPEGMPMRGVVAGLGDLGGAALSGLGAAYGFGAGLVGEVVGGDPTQERKLASDLMMMGEVAVPELAGVSGTIRAAGAAARGAETASKPATAAQSAARAADDLGITPALGMGGKIRATTAAGLEKVPLTGGVIAKDAERAVGEVEGVFARLRNSIGTASNVAGAGEKLQEGLQGFVGRFKQTAEKFFNVVDQRIPQDRRFPVSATAARIEDAKAIFEGNPELAQRLGLNSWDAIVAEAQANGVTWPALKQFRSSIGEAIGNLESGKQGGSLSSENLSRLKSLYGALTEDMEAAARSVGDDAYTAWRRANNYYKGGAERIERSLDQTIRADNPERAFVAFQNLLSEGRTTSDITRVRQIKASLNRDEWSDVAASIVDRLGRPAAGQQNAAGDAFSPAVFLTNWNKMDPEARRLLMPEDVRIEFEKLAEVAGAMKAANLERNFSNTGTAAGWLATIFGSAADMGTTATALAGSYVSAKALTSRTFLQALNRAARGDTKALRAMANGNNPFKQDAAEVLRLIAADAAVGDPANTTTQPIRAVP